MHIPFLEQFQKRSFLKHTILASMGTIAASILNYLYQLSMGNLLAKEDFAVLSVFISLFFIIMLPLPSITTAAAKIITKNKDNLPILRTITIRLLGIFSGIGLFCSLSFFISIPLLQNYLHIEETIPFIIVCIFFFFTILLGAMRSILRGRLLFLLFAIATGVEPLLKLLISLPLVLIGYGVNGALTGFLLGTLIVFIITIFMQKDLLTGKKHPSSPPLKGFTTDSLTYLAGLASLTLCYTLDIILIKHFYEANETFVGDYAALALLAKIPLWLTSSIVMVMFPYSALLAEKRTQARRLLKKAFLAVFSFSLPALAIFFLIPEFFLSIFFPKYTNVAPYLGPMGLFVFFISCSLVLLNYHLAANRNKVAIIPFIFFVAEIIGLYRYHNSMPDIITVLNATMGLLLISLLVYSFLIRTAPLLKKS